MHLLGRDRIAVRGEDVGVHHAGQRLAVHQHAVAIEDDEVERHLGNELPVATRATVIARLDRATQ
jgi:hypothetical protein